MIYTKIIVAITVGSSFLFYSDKPSIASEPPQAVDVYFYGCLIDQDGQPVADATVHAFVYNSLDNKAQPARKISVNADAAGVFEINVTGVRLDILTIKKRGYEFSINRRNDLTWAYSGDPQKGIFVPDAASPVVFTIRKKSAPVFLVRSQSLMRFKPGKTMQYIRNEVTGSFRDFTDAAQTGRNTPTGLKVTTKLSDDATAYELSFQQGDDGSGVIVADELLHEAPEDGYTKRAMAAIRIPDKANELEKYVYIKTKGSGENEWTYSRTDLNMIVGKAELIIKTTTWTNPDGSRSLEYDEKFQREEIARRVEEYRNNPDPQNGPMPHYLRQPSPKARSWDFAANRRRVNKEKREHIRAAEGIIREKKRTVNRPKED